jgi:hypothetical protein
MNNLMLDIKTMSKQPNAAIVQISAIFFDPHSNAIGEKFSMSVSERNCVEWGLHVEYETIKWWESQGKEANKLVFSDPNGLKFSIRKFFCFIIANSEENDPEKIIIWANSPAFHCVILQNAVKTVIGRNETLWNFRNERDVRTLSALFPEVAKNHVYTGEKHNGVDDCLNQIRIVQKCFNYLEKNTGNKIFILDIESYSFESKTKGCIRLK